MPNDITIESILNTDILTCPPETPLSKAAALMVEAYCSSILVEEHGKMVGIWTEQDALALDVFDPEAFDKPITEFMSSPVKVIGIDTGLGEAALRFREEGVRHFLVVDDNGRHRGIVTQSDIVMNQGIEYYVAMRDVKSVLNRHNISISGTALLSEAIQRMTQEGCNALITRCPDGVYGILTERDVVRHIGSGQALKLVGELASRPLICVSSDSSLYNARKLFIKSHIRHLGVTSEDGELLGLVTFSDILASIEYDYVNQLRETLREREQSLAISNQHLRLAAKAFESTFEGIMVTTADNVIESVNPAFTQITGYKSHEVIGKTPGLLSSGRHDEVFYRKMREDLDQAGHWQGEIWNKRRNGEIFAEWLTINSVKDNDGKVTNYVAVFSDITMRKAAEEQMRFLAHHDALTSLPNRALLMERLRHAIPHAHRNKKKVAVMFLDLDRFKRINDTLGHPIGDQLLRIVAQRLTACVRGEDTVARLSGDEFIVLLEEIHDADMVPPIARKVVAALAQPLHIEGHEVGITTSLGISVFPDDGKTPDDLIKHADAAMYLAKEDGRNNFKFYRPVD
ncbi:MAG: diguanylate cyclase [Sulfuricella sp.]|nr:diguanylate cyclase [Sulfuricella sp.]